MTTLPLAVRLMRRELRGGLRGFRIFLACLALGVAVIMGAAVVGSLVGDGAAPEQAVRPSAAAAQTTIRESFRTM